MSWHGNADLLDAYRENRLDPARASSLEAHLIECAQCRAAIAARRDGVALDRMWSVVLDRVDVPRPRPLERLLTRCGIAPHAVRLVAAVPAARLAWGLGVAVTMLVAAGLVGAADDATALLLLVAPLVPLATVALTFSRSADPAYEVTLVTTTPALRLLLIRAAAVVIGSLVVVAVAALVVPGIGWEAAGWLLPGLALTCASLALTSWLPVRVGVLMAAAAWVSVLAVAIAATDDPTAADLSALLLSANTQLLCAALAAVALAVTIIRRDAFESLPAWRILS